MKKYLMTGIAALALCVGFTSCSHDVEQLSQEEMTELQNQQMVLNYQKAFVATFGQPAANHKWGFVDYSQTRTRNNGIDGAINVNGNMWTECPGVRVENDEEVNAIFNYVKEGIEYMDEHDMPYATTHPENLNGYFVTQVRSGNNNYADNTYTNIYNNNQEVKNVGSWMNHLQIAFNENPSMADLNNATTDNVSGWEHINNFNGSSNIDWGAADSKEKGNTKVENKGAYDFAYYNSLDSKYHNKWILVDGADISDDPYYADFYYVCFDFESRPTNNTTFITYTGKNDSGQWQTGYNAELPGTYFTVDEITKELTELPNGTKISDIKDITITRYLYGDKMLKGDNKYTDWIVRITKGEKTPPPAEWDLRIICEDLNATATAADPEDSDWDFNDLVLDVKFLGSDKVKMRVYAAGATLPIRINGEDALEVHGLYGKPTNIMINTGAAAAGYPNQAYESNGVYPTAAIFERTISGVDASYGANIKIEVEKGAGNWIELEAKAGQPASKMGVLPDFEPCAERQDIQGRYSNFVAWVTKQNPVYWWRSNNQ